ncbi:hypothetical protein M3Y97_00657900 [Aphelenchoides bicaudatus]|nr:hypothetical protein M3Y97_00657900 [Aphelenchoides bicaudatus]
MLINISKLIVYGWWSRNLTSVIVLTKVSLSQVIMSNLAGLYGFIDTFGASCGIFTNFLLIIAIFKTSGRAKIQSFSYMVLVSAIFDTFFCVIEVLTQHQTLVKKGVLFLMPHGIETVLGPWSYYVFMIPHVFSCTMAVVIRGPQYKFRYDLISGQVNDPIWDLFKYVLVAMSAALFCGVSASFGIYQANQRGKQHYLDQMDGPTFNDNFKKYFLYACDIRDIGTIGFYGGGLVFTTICFWLCVYWVWKTQKYVNGRGEERSERTKAMQRQFTLSLIAQSINALVFAIIPVSMVCASMILRLDAEFIGMGTMVPLSWLSSANAILTLLIVKAYREFLKSLVWGRSGKVNQSSAENQSIDKKQLASSRQVKSIDNASATQTNNNTTSTQK